MGTIPGMTRSEEPAMRIKAAVLYDVGYARGLLDIDRLVTRRYPLADINRAYDDIETDGVGRGVLVP